MVYAFDGRGRGNARWDFAWISGVTRVHSYARASGRLVLRACQGRDTGRRRTVRISVFDFSMGAGGNLLSPWERTEVRAPLRYR